MACEEKGRDFSDAATSQRMPSIAQSHEKLGKDLWENKYLLFSATKFAIIHDSLGKLTNPTENLSFRNAYKSRPKYL